MTLQLIVPQSESSAPQDAPAAYSTAWWEGRSCDELRQVVQRGLRGGEFFDGAIREMHRRERELAAQEGAQAAAEALQRETIKRRVLAGGVLLVAVAALAALSPAF